MAKDNCDNCVYRGTIYNLSCCNYYFMTNQRRPCPPGEACTAKAARSVYRKRESSPEEISASEEMRKAKNREKQKKYYEKHKDEINAKARANRLAKSNS